MNTKWGKRKKLVIIAGPTGSGKTSVSLQLARHFQVPIISTDSRQLYKGIPVGTAQPTDNEQAMVKHYFIACAELEDCYTAGRYEQEALRRLEELFEVNDMVIAVGGSGLYIKALCEGFDNIPDPDPDLRAELNEEFERNGISPLLDELRTTDPDYYHCVDTNNPQRVIRALEVMRSTGKPFSSFRMGVKKERDFEIIKIGIDLPREALYEKINLRVDLMLQDGLEQEAKNVCHLKYLNSLQTVGYRELFDYFDGRISFDQAVDLIKRNSRRYAKRQLTWFRSDKDIKWFEPTMIKQMIDYIENHIS